MKDFFGTIGMIVFGALLIFGISYGSYQMYAFFAPRYRAVDNQVFKQSEQYNDGMIRDLENLQMEYVKATDEQKGALKAIILHRFSVYPEEKLPANLRNFYNQLRNGQ
jgi:hypothetical protein